MPTPAGRPAALVLLAAVCFGTTGTAQALGPDTAGSASLGAVRVVVGGTLLALVAWAVHRRNGTRLALSRRELALVGLGAAGVVAYQPAFFAGARLGGVAVGTLLALGSAPVFTGLLEWLVLRRRPTRTWLAATALAICGVAVLTAGTGLTGGGLHLAGAAASLAAGAAYAVYTLVSKSLLAQGWSPEATMGALFGTAAVVMLAALPLTDLTWLATPSGLTTGIFLGVVPTAVAYLLFARGLRRLPAAQVATLTLAEPLTAGILGVLLLGEPFGARTAAGATLLAAGLVLLALRAGGPPPRYRPT